MALRVGQVLRGARGSYELLSALKDATVFKAKVLPSSAIKSDWAMVKTAYTNAGKQILSREHHNHTLPPIASCAHIRSLQDTIYSEDSTTEPSSLVFEWMDYDAGQISDDEYRHRPVLTKRISKGVLEALVAIRSLNAMHTDIKPGNIFLSDIDGSPVAKLGDLGNMVLDGCTTQRLQCAECRAPEVWQGLGPRHASDIWSLGVTLTTLLAGFGVPLFGPGGNSVKKLPVAAWCIGKMICLVGPLPHPDKSSSYKEEYDLAEELAVAYDKSQWKIISRLHWRDELGGNQNPPVSEPLLDFINSLLVVEHEKRPTAAEALKHPYFEIASDEDIECEPFIFPAPQDSTEVQVVDGMEIQLSFSK